MEWTRRHLKQKAKNAIRGKARYWKMVLVSFILIIASGTSSGGGSGSSNNMGQQDTGSNFLSEGTRVMESVRMDSETLRWIMGLGGLFLLIIGVAIGIGIVFTSFLLNPLYVGGSKYILENAESAEAYLETEIPDDGPSLGLLGYGFGKEKYLSIVGTMLLKEVFLLLWTMVFIIPGIVKFYSYSMVPFILADNPRIGLNRAIDLSRDMMRGEKWNFFILQLSFIGRLLLGLLAFLIGVFFLTWPYYYGTKAELYRVLREKALQEGLCTYEELNFHTP